MLAMAETVMHKLHPISKVLSAVVLVMLPISSAPAQNSAATSQTTASAAPTLAFGTVSIKLNNSGSKAMVRATAADSDALTFNNVPLFLIILYAYHINDFNLVEGFPDWTRSERYDLTAKVDESDVAEFRKLSSTQRGQMLQKVLADRFKLQVHHDSKDVPVFALVPAKGGVRMKETKPGDSHPNVAKLGSNGMVHGATVFLTGPGQMTGEGASVADIAGALSDTAYDYLGRRVVDKSGLTARYDFKLQFAPNATGADSDSDSQPQGAAGPSISTAVQEQLGLKLEPAKVPTEFLVIDHAERPSQN
jgi:uncharacterized protein (TIGR03435 family)